MSLAIYSFHNQKPIHIPVRVPRSFMNLFEVVQFKRFGISPVGTRVYVVRGTDKKMLLCKLKRPGSGREKHLWVTGACGMVTYGEAPVHAAVRETEEELGWQITSDQLTLLGIATPTRGYPCIIYNHLLVLKEQEQPRLNLSDCYCEFMWVDPRNHEELDRYSIRPSARDFLSEAEFVTVHQVL